MTSTPQFSEFRHMLADLGFNHVRVDGSHHAFRHEATNTIIMLRLLADADPVPPVDIISARLVIAGRGLATVDRFNELLEAAEAQRV